MEPKSLRKRIWFATKIIRFFLRLGAVLRIFVRVRVTNRSAVPKYGPVIVCANHPSTVDPVLLFGALRRNVAFFAKSGLFKTPVVGHVMRWMGHIPVFRGTDAARDSLIYGTRVLQNDGLVGIFLEGGCSVNGHMRSPKGGMALMAFATGATVVPVGIVGTNDVKNPNGGGFRLWRRVQINVGEPVRAPYVSDEAPVEDREAFTELVYRQLWVLSRQDDLPPLPV